jgi:hypothetical protein
LSLNRSSQLSHFSGFSLWTNPTWFFNEENVVKLSEQKSQACCLPVSFEGEVGLLCSSPFLMVGSELLVFFIFS